MRQVRNTNRMCLFPGIPNFLFCILHAYASVCKNMLITEGCVADMKIQNTVLIGLWVFVVFYRPSLYENKQNKRHQATVYTCPYLTKTYIKPVIIITISNMLLQYFFRLLVNKHRNVRDSWSVSKDHMQKGVLKYSCTDYSV